MINNFVGPTKQSKMVVETSMYEKGEQIFIKAYITNKDNTIVGNKKIVFYVLNMMVKSSTSSMFKHGILYYEYVPYSDTVDDVNKTKVIEKTLTIDTGGKTWANSLTNIDLPKEGCSFVVVVQGTAQTPLLNDSSCDTNYSTNCGTAYPYEIYNAAGMEWINIPVVQ